MAGGINSLKNTLENLKKYLERTFTKEMATQLSLDVHQVANLTKQIEESGLVKALNTFMDSANKEDLAAKLGKSSEQVSALLERLGKTDVIENLDKLLDRVNSYADLLGIEEFLKSYGHAIPYAIVGYTVFSAFLPIALAYAATRGGNNQQFQKFCKQKLDLLAATSMQTMKFTAGSYLLAHGANSSQGLVEEQDQERLGGLASHARQVIDFTPDLDMALLNTFAQELFNNLYVESGVNPMDAIGKDMPAGAIDAVAKGNFQSIPTSTNGQLSYALVKKLYGEVAIEQAMQALQLNLSQNGGDSIYYDLRSSPESRDKRFSSIIRDIHQAYKNGTALCTFNQIQLLNCLKDAKNFLTAQLADIQLTDDAAKAVTNRALLEFCHKTSGYFFFPWNLKEEVSSGVSDTVDMLSVDGLCASFRTLTFSDDNPRRSKLTERPIRAITHYATTAATVAGVAVAAVAVNKRRIGN